MILQIRYTSVITQSLKEIHRGRETGLIDTGPLSLISPMVSGKTFENLDRRMGGRLMSESLVYKNSPMSIRLWFA